MRIDKTKKILTEIKNFNNNNNFSLKFEEKGVKYYEGITYCLETEKIRKKDGKDNYLEAYF